MKTLLCAIGFVLVLEGFLPLIKPEYWKKMMMESSRFSTEKVRKIGFVSVGLGLAVVWAVMLFFE